MVFRRACACGSGDSSSRDGNGNGCANSDDASTGCSTQQLPLTVLCSRCGALQAAALFLPPRSLLIIAGEARYAW
jgi:hypothetical protein